MPRISPLCQLCLRGILLCTGAQYYDAKWVQKAVTRLVLVETLGGIAPPTKQFLHVFAKEKRWAPNTDRTVYGAASASASGGARGP